MAFREMVRKKQAIDEAECIGILKKELRGVLSVCGDEGYPYGMPLNHYYDGRDGCLYFHSGKTGHKIDAIKRCDKVSYCVYDEGVRDEEGKVPWSLNFKCVIVFGRVEIVSDHGKAMEIARLLSHKFTDDEEYIEREIEGSGPGTLVFRVVPEHMSGKRVNES